jgi:ribosomal-protein-alanine N-acetyltransferase
VTAPGTGPILATPRLRLVPCGEEDVDRLHALLTHPDVRRYLMDDLVVEPKWVFDLVQSSRGTFADASFGLWCLETREEGEFAGLAGLRVTAGAREPQLLYALDRAHWGRGLATEASEAVGDYAFDELGYRELMASTDPPNLASMQVMQRLGMRFLETVRAGNQPIVFYRIDRDEWMRRRGLRKAATGGGAR